MIVHDLPEYSSMAVKQNDMNINYSARRLLTLLLVHGQLFGMRSAAEVVLLNGDVGRQWQRVLARLLWVRIHGVVEMVRICRTDENRRVNNHSAICLCCVEANSTYRRPISTLSNYCPHRYKQILSALKPFHKSYRSSSLSSPKLPAPNAAASTTH